MHLTLLVSLVIVVTIVKAQNTTSSNLWTTEGRDGQTPFSWYQRMELVNQISFYGNMNIGVLAVITNVITLRVMLKHKPTTPHVYLICIAACDLLTGVAIMGNAVMGTTSLLRKYPRLRVVSFHAQVPCLFIRLALGDASTFVLNALSLDRLIAIKHPMQHISWCTVRRARIVCIILLGFSFVFSTNILVRLTSVWAPEGVPYQTTSDIGKIPLVDAIFMHTKFIIQQAIPLTMMCITNTWTIQQVIKGNRFRRSTSNSKDQSGGVQCLGMTLGITAYFLLTHTSAAFYALNQAINDNVSIYKASIELSIFIICLEFLRWMGTFMNFFFYVFFDRKFRHHTDKLIFGWCRSASNGEKTTASSSQM
ncbi:hypothetical protein CAPTEDRAFT_199221 [Capitella teleta]|uniref:G-protein coupled receptors family 1 profile domain-containing protein n=1 Tax=Capitella teleta TaxID=283909 RepID=R7V1V9_CAPTE|nr:hypothetical protein CAPTEDRAFT_199221 [Capitella teleta]|eukprot:ELU09656.1 hypothetical protein CAPTEDRAFT_199221 [Capitella teleta]